MEFQTLGKTGLKVSRLCLGTMQFGWTASEPLSERILSAAFDAGINFFDTANIYSRWSESNPGGVAEKVIGRWMKNCGIQRDQVVLASKVRGNMGGGPEDEGLSRRHILKAVEDTLQRMQTDHLDLYQAHWPDTATPIEETLRAFDDLVKQGKVRAVGASNYAAWELMQSLWAADKNGTVRFDTLQPHYNLVHRDEFERELAEVCRIYEIAVLSYSPLAGGFLTGKYRRNLVPQSARAGSVQRYFTEANWTLLEVLDGLAKEKNATVSQVALAWVLANPRVTSAILGVNSLDQLADNLAALKIRFNAEDMTSLGKASAWTN